MPCCMYIIFAEQLSSGFLFSIGVSQYKNTQHIKIKSEIFKLYILINLMHFKDIKQRVFESQIGILMIFKVKL